MGLYMRVLLIRPPARHTVESEVPEAVEAENLSYPPLALLAIASFLRDQSDHVCDILDAQLEDLEYDVIEKRVRDLFFQLGRQVMRGAETGRREGLRFIDG